MLLRFARGENKYVTGGIASAPVSMDVSETVVCFVVDVVEDVVPNAVVVVVVVVVDENDDDQFVEEVATAVVVGDFERDGRLESVRVDSPPPKPSSSPSFSGATP